MWSKFNIGGSWMEPNYPKGFTVKGPHKGYVKGSPYRLEHQAIVEGKLEGNPLNPWTQEHSKTFFPVHTGTFEFGRNDRLEDGPRIQINRIFKGSSDQPVYHF